MPNINLVLGIDIGGTNTSFGLVDGSGNIICAQSIETRPNDSAGKFVTRLHNHIEEMRTRVASPHHLCGIGVGVPNAHNFRGTIEKPVNLRWGNSVNFVKMIRQYYDIAISITNDAKAAAIGEMVFGNARGMKNFMVIALGTGLGSGIVVDGHLLYGNSGFAGELGHTVVKPDGRQCQCGKNGCLETYVSATGIVRTVSELLAVRREASPLRFIRYRDITSKLIFELAKEGDVIALEAFDQTARILGMKLADAVAHTSPEAIFLTGGMSMAGNILLKPTKRYLDAFLFRAYSGTVKLMLSGMEQGKSAILGAAALIWSEIYD